MILTNRRNACSAYLARNVSRIGLYCTTRDRVTYTSQDRPLYARQDRSVYTTCGSVDIYHPQTDFGRCQSRPLSAILPGRRATWSDYI